MIFPQVAGSALELRRVHHSHAVVPDELTQPFGEFARRLYAPLFGKHEIRSCEGLVLADCDCAFAAAEWTQRLLELLRERAGRVFGPANQ